MNADGYYEQTVPIKLPSKRGVDDPTEVRPSLYNIAMEPKTVVTTTAQSAISDGKPDSTYRSAATTPAPPSLSVKQSEEEDGDREITDLPSSIRSLQSVSVSSAPNNCLLPPYYTVILMYLVTIATTTLPWNYVAVNL